MSKYPSIKKPGIEINFNDDYIHLRCHTSITNNTDVNFGSYLSTVVTISFDDERYDRIYKSLLKQVNEVGYFSGYQDNYLFSLYCL
jgi:predicted transport protein